MDRNREYAQSLMELLAMILERSAPSDPMRQPNEHMPSFIFVITSDMGLCGGYNANIYRAALQDLKEHDVLCIIGSRGAAWARSRGLKVEENLTDLTDDMAYDELAGAMNLALRLYDEGKVGSIKVLYTKYVNTLTFEPTLESLIPPEPPEVKTDNVAVSTIFEPKRSVMLDTIMPMAAKSQLYSRYLESKTSEQASRRMAMETATDNANELMDELNLEYNRVRQTAITQEITEIVSGANALA